MKEKDLERLSFEKQLLFGLCLSERIVHFYREFDKIWGEQFHDTIYKSLEDSYEDLVNGAPQGRIRRDEILNLIPDTDEYEGYEALFAQNAGISLLGCIDFCVSHLFKDIMVCSKKVEETIDVKTILILDKSDRESAIAIHEEHVLQMELISILSRFPETISEIEVETIRNFATNNKIEV
jgi:uncharacterized protein YjaG (DUF416 family)